MAQEQRKPNTDPAAEPLQGQLSLEGFEPITNTAPAAEAQETEQAQQVEQAQEPQEDVIYIDIPTNIDPELNPNSPQFDLEKFKAFIATDSSEYQKRLDSLAENVKSSMQTISEVVHAFANTKPFFDAIKQQAEMTGSIIDSMRRFTESDSFKRLSKMFIDMPDWIQTFAEMPDVVDAIEPLIPYLEEEIADLRLQPGYESITLDDVLNIMELDGTPITEIDGKPVDNLLIRAIEQAKKKQDTAEAAKNFEAALPRLQSMNPKKHIMPNNKLANSISALITAGDARDLVVANKTKRRPEITTYTSVTLENMNGITFTGKPYTVYDRAVHDAVVSFYVEAKRRGWKTVYFTPANIYRCMTGKTETETPSAQTIGHITRSIEKMRLNIHVKADASEEMRRRKITFNGEQITSFSIDSFLLSLTAVDITAGGNKVKGYRIDAEPILYEYSKLTGQLLSSPSDILDIRELTAGGQISPLSLANTESRISIKSYLLQRIQVMRNSARKAADDQFKEDIKARKEGRTANKIEPEQKPVILFDSIFEATGITDKDTKTDARKYVFSVLEYWKAKKFIADYSKRAKGRSFDAVEIIF